IV
ncbi:hypothetical protein ACTFIZ_004212, partial [Dictyostelium cf. discoideum]